MAFGVKPLGSADLVLVGVGARVLVADDMPPGGDNLPGREVVGIGVFGGGGVKPLPEIAARGLAMAQAVQWKLPHRTIRRESELLRYHAQKVTTRMQILLFLDLEPCGHMHTCTCSHTARNPAPINRKPRDASMGIKHIRLTDMQAHCAVLIGEIEIVFP